MTPGPGVGRPRDALAAGIADRAVEEDAVRPTAVGTAKLLTGKAGDALDTIKSRMYGPALAALRDEENPLG